MRAHKWHGENQTVMLFNLPQPMGLVAVHPARQPAGIPIMLLSLIGKAYLYPDAIKITPLMICMCGLTIFRWKLLFEESLFSHLPAFCCGTSILLMCLPLRLDTGSRPNHLHPRYAFGLMKGGSHQCSFWLKKEIRSDAFGGLMYFILEHTWKNCTHSRGKKRYSIWKQWTGLRLTEVLFSSLPFKFSVKHFFHRHKFKESYHHVFRRNNEKTRIL